MTIDTRRTALLVMDVQPGIIERVAEPDAFLARTTTTIAHARQAGIRIIQVVVGFRPGAPEASPMFRQFAANLIDPRPVIALGEGDILVTKRRVSAFTGSDLEVVLRTNDIRHLVLAGIATSGVVLSTIREAADRDYELTVLSDICADMDDEVHTVLTTKVFPRQAKVMTSAEWMAANQA
jgi:nicotinamidase-related amidase